MVTPYFMGHENPATKSRSLKLTHSRLRDMTKFLAAVGLRILDGVSPNVLQVSQILGIYYLVSQKLAHVDKDVRIHARKPRL